MDVKSVILVAPNNHRQEVLFYTVKEEAGRSYVKLKYPLPESHSLEINFVSGYGGRPDDIPGDIRQAIIVYVSCLYEHRTGIDRSDSVSTVGLRVVATASRFAVPIPNPRLRLSSIPLSADSSRVD